MSVNNSLNNTHCTFIVFAYQCEFHMSYNIRRFQNCYTYVTTCQLIKALDSYLKLITINCPYPSVIVQSCNFSQPAVSPFSSWFSESECFRFYRAMLCMRGTRHAPVFVCVCVSVTSRCCTKTAKHWITQTTPHDSPGTLVFCCQRTPQNSTAVTPYKGTKCRWGGSKLATFDK